MKQEKPTENLTLIYQKMKDNQFNGEIIIDSSWIVWKFGENIIVKATIDNSHEEGYISIN
jgi:hypothetical protein